MSVTEKLLFTNNASTTMSGSLTQGGATLVLATATGDMFPAPSTNEAFLLTIYEKDLSNNETRIEVAKCTARTADTLTIERDVEGITGQVGGYAYPSAPGAVVYVQLRWTAACAENALQAAGVHNASSKPTPVDADELPLIDSAASNVLKKLTWANVKATLKTYLDTLYQPIDATLTALAGVTTAADKLPYFTGADTASTTTLTAAGRAILDDADAAAQRATLGLVIGTDVQAYDATLAAIADDSLGAYSHRNKIIGGNFTTNPWQRGTTFTAPASAAFTADRFVIQNTSSAVVDVFKTNDAVDMAAAAGCYSPSCLHVDITTADTSIGASDTLRVTYKVEGYDAAPFGFGVAGTRYVTLSFSVKATKTGTYCVSFRSTGSTRSYVAEYTVDASDTWERKTITIPVDTSGTWDYTNGVGLVIDWALACGSTYHAPAANTWYSANYIATANQVNAADSTSNNFKINLVQLESGSIATPFEHRPAAVEWGMCYRYYWRATVNSSNVFGTGFNSTTTNSIVYVQFPVRMRVYPTALDQTGTASDYMINQGASTHVCDAVPVFSNATALGARIATSTAVAITAGSGSHFRAATTAAYLGFSAEL